MYNCNIAFRFGISETPPRLIVRGFFLLPLGHYLQGDVTVSKYSIEIHFLR